MKISEKLESVLCDPEGTVCITGSAKDKRILKEAITKVKLLERALSENKELFICANCEKVTDSVSPSRFKHHFRSDLKLQET